MNGTDTLDPLEELIAEIAQIQKAIIQELQDRRARLSRELASVDAELAEWTGEPAIEVKAAPAAPAATTHRSVTLRQLIAELEAAPDKTLNIRKAHLDAKSIKALAKANPDRLKLGGKGAWPTVTLLERAAAGSQQETFAFKDPATDAQSAGESR
ncbi:MAG: hypothetical protein ABJF10_20230 [Chthoniobacter sp.]|uniref:hypothetical protein n=1 Tax=Chthoniobacter sp. TaxID=2510640 RepID=UPI0032AC6420